MKGMKIAAFAVVAMMVVLGGVSMPDTDVDASGTTYINVGEKVNFPVRGPITCGGSFPVRYDSNLFPYNGGTACGLEMSSAYIREDYGCLEIYVKGTALHPGTINVGVRMVNSPQQHTFVTFETIVIQATADYPSAYFEDIGWLSCPKGKTVTAPMHGDQVVDWKYNGVTYQSGDEIPLVGAQSDILLQSLMFSSNPADEGRSIWIR